MLPNIKIFKYFRTKIHKYMIVKHVHMYINFLRVASKVYIKFMCVRVFGGGGEAILGPTTAHLSNFSEVRSRLIIFHS